MNTADNENVRFMPMPVPLPKWICVNSGYPDLLRVSFRNGKVRSYVPDFPQPKPHIISNAEWDRLYLENGGYKARHAKK